MNFQGKAVLVYLEEDNIARAYFRIQPLMTQDGPVGETKPEYPDDGYLRIVPDKNEQHTFKERMRAMCGLCIMDLRHLPAEANKIRTNKNYSPTRGETNQYIIYSDAVQAMPEDLIYQVVAEGGVATASTPLVYIRNGANIQGPFRREDGQSVGDTVQLPPDSSEIHSVTVQGQELLFYWPKVETPVAATVEEKPAFEEAQAAPAPAETENKQAEEEEKSAEENPVEKDPRQNAYEQIQALNVAPSATANRLHDSSSRTPVDFIPDHPPKPLIGTKLYQSPQKQVSPRRAHNPLMEAVERERYAAKYEAPGATLPQSAELKEVHNPADALKRALASMWQSPETQSQAVSVVLSQPGMRALLSKSVSREANDLTVAAMQGQLQELEAERLMTLMQLDDVKKNLAAAREEAVGKLNMAEQKKLDELHIAQQNAQNALDQLDKAIGPAEEKYQQLAEKIHQVESALDYPVRLVAARTGSATPKEELIARVEECLKVAGFAVNDGDALALLAAFALTEKEWEFCCDAVEDAEAAIHAFAAALGATVEQDHASEIILMPGGNVPVLIQDQDAPHNPLATRVNAACHAEEKSEYFLPVAPRIALDASLDTLPGKLPAYAPVSKDSIVREMMVETGLSDDTKAVVTALRKAMAEAGKGLPLSAVNQLCRFIAATQNDFKGGVAEAIDRAVCLYAVPYLLAGAEIEHVKPLLSAMPRTLKALNE
ncbi:MAG: hypothetical protein IJ189_07665 [Clostridia bacterium]|nr:hypothetical protein [Clostridia bacterium]